MLKNPVIIGSLMIILAAHLTIDFMLGVWPVYKTLMTLDLVIAGLIASIGMLIGEGLQIYFGFLSDRGYHQRLITLGIGLTCTIPFLAYVENEWLLFIFILCSYIGSGAFHPSASSLIMGWSSSSRSLLVALFACGGTIGAGMSQFVFSHVYLNYEGQTWIFVVPILVLTLCCGLFSFPRAAVSNQPLKGQQILRELKPYRQELFILYIIQVSLQAVVIAFTFLLPDILQLRGYDPAFCLGGGYLCFILGAASISIPIGYCIDRFGYRFILRCIILMGMTLIYTFLSAPQLPLAAVMILLALIGGTMGIIVPVMVAGANTVAPAQTRGIVSAFYMGGASCLAGFGPIIACILAAYFEEQAPVRALQWMGFLFVIPVCLFYFLPRRALQTDALENMISS